MRTITVAECRTALQALRDRTDPSFRYTDGAHGCYYNASLDVQQLVRANAQRCIIGQLLFDLGIDLPQTTFDKARNYAINSPAEGSIHALAIYLLTQNIDFEGGKELGERSLFNVLYNSQNMQDNGKTWHEAIDVILTKLPS